MPLALQRGGVLKHLRHALIFYGDPPTVPVAQGLYHLNCKREGQRKAYEAGLRAELIRRYGLHDIRMVHVHSAQEMKAAVEKSKGVIWDVVGWVGHAAEQASDFLPTLDERDEHGRIIPGTVITVEQFLPIMKGLSQPPKEFLLLGCDAACDEGLGEKISKGYPNAQVVAGVKKSHVVLSYDIPNSAGSEQLGDEKSMPEIPFNRVEIEGMTVVFKNGVVVMDDAGIQAELQMAINQPDLPDVPLLADSTIVVKVKNGVVTLTGEIPLGGSVQRATAARIVREHGATKGHVKQIVDHLRESARSLGIDGDFR